MTRRGRVLAIAHRGAAVDRPENTLAAFDEALRQGADGIELDVQLSRDGVPLVYHDARLHRAGGGGRRLCQLDHEAVRRLPGPRLDSWPERQHIPSLEEVLVLYGHRVLLMLEIKALENRTRHERLARSVIHLVHRTKTERDVMILSFDNDVLDACREGDPSIRRIWNLDRRPLLNRRLARRLPSLFGAGVDVRHLSRSTSASVSDAGKALLVYTCNEADEVDSALEHGASFVVSDRPGWLRAHLQGSRNTEHEA